MKRVRPSRGLRFAVVVAATLAGLAVVLAGAGMLGLSSEKRSVISEADLRAGLPTAEEVGSSMGSSSMRLAADADDEGQWDRDDVDGTSTECDRALQEIEDSDVLFGTGFGDGRQQVARAFADESYADVTVMLASGGDEVVDDVATLVEACADFNVDGLPGASIRGAAQERIDPVGVDGEAFAFRQRFIYTDVDNVYKGQVWSRDGVVALVTANAGLDAEGRPVRTTRSQLEALVRCVDRKLADIARH